MSDRPSVLQIAQLGVEGTAGVAATATRRLRSMTQTLEADANVDELRASGYKVVTMTALNEEWTTSTWEGEPDFNEIVYPLNGVLKNVAGTVAGTAGGGTAYSWLFEIDSDGIDTPATYTLQRGDANHANEATRLTGQELELSVSRSDAALSAGFIGQRLESATLGTTAAFVSDRQRPMLPGLWKVYLDDSAASLGSTKLTRMFNATVSIGGRNEPIWTVDADEESWAASIEGETDLGITLQVGADAQGTALLNTLRLGDTKFVRLEALGGTIAGTHIYTNRVDAAVQVISAPSEDDADGVTAWEWELRIVHDDTWGKSLSWYVKNAIGSL
jgi:hypothetical protein